MKKPSGKPPKIDWAGATAGATVKHWLDVNPDKDEADLEYAKVGKTKYDPVSAVEMYELALKNSKQRYKLPSYPSPPSEADFSSPDEHAKAIKKYELKRKWQNGLERVERSPELLVKGVKWAVKAVTEAIAGPSEYRPPSELLNKLRERDTSALAALKAGSKDHAKGRLSSELSRGAIRRGIDWCFRTWVGRKVALGLAIGQELLLRAHPQRVTEQHGVGLKTFDGNEERFETKLPNHAATRALHEEFTRDGHPLIAGAPVGSGLVYAAGLMRRLSVMAKRLDAQGETAAAKTVRNLRWWMLGVGVGGAVPGVGETLAAGLITGEVAWAKNTMGAPVATVNALGHEASGGSFKDRVERSAKKLGDSVSDVYQDALDRRDRWLERDKLANEAALLAATDESAACEVLFGAVQETVLEQLAADELERLASQEADLGHTESAEMLREEAELHHKTAQKAAEVADIIEASLEANEAEPASKEDIGELAKLVARDAPGEDRSESGDKLAEAAEKYQS